MKKWVLIISIFFMGASVFAQGDWMTDQNNQCQVWDPNPTPQQSLTWTGECKNGKANSQGIAEWHEAGKVVTSIEGVMEDGRCQGKCLIYITSGKNKFTYSGQLKDNDLDGKGTLTQQF